MSDAYINARDTGLRNGERMRAEQEQNALRAAQRQAGTSIAGGDYAGGANALFGAGDLSGGMAVQDQQRQTSAAALAARQAAQERQQHALVAGAQGLRYLPADQRWQAFQARVLPVLQQEGLGPDVLGQITPDHMSDTDLDSVIAMHGGEVAQPRYLQGARGALDVIDPYSNRLTNVRQPEREGAPSGFRWNAAGTGVEPIPGYVEGRAEVATRTRAPRRAASGGSSSRPATSAAPAGRPWERSW